jgi:hypothetical protein
MPIRSDKPLAQVDTSERGDVAGLMLLEVSLIEVLKRLKYDDSDTVLPSRFRANTGPITTRVIPISRRK